MRIALPYGSTLTDAFKLAKERGILPTWMGTAELRELGKALKERAVFSARTTHADYLQALRTAINKLIEGGYGGTQAELRAGLKEVLAQLGYDPVTGFPGDQDLGIPPAEPGSLRDLSSDRRINLILDTQTQLLAGKGQQQRGLEPAALDLFPCYELVRGGAVRVPREWLKRWKLAADEIDWEGVSREAFAALRMVALKTSGIWAAIGSSALFDDALDVDHSPFAFGSMMVRVEREDQWGDMGAQQGVKSQRAEAAKLPAPVKSVNGLDRDFVEALNKKVAGVEERNGKLTIGGTVQSAVERALERRKARANALDACLDAAVLRVEINAFTRRQRGRETGEKGRGKRGQVKAVKQPGKRCGKGWIASWMTCSKVAGVVGTDGDAASLGLPGLRAMGTPLVAERPSLHAARAEMAAKPKVEAPTGDEVGFGKIAMDHVRIKAAAGEVDRARWINHAKAAIASPLEIWRDGMRHRYIAVFETRGGRQPFIVVTTRLGEHREGVVSFHPKTWGKLDEDRSGTFLFKGYETD